MTPTVIWLSKKNIFKLNCVNQILSIKYKKKIYTFLNSYLKRLRKSKEINYVKRNGLIYTVKDPCSTWNIYSCRWSILVICGWENLSWKSLLMQMVSKTSSLQIVVYQMAAWRFNRILLIKHKKKIYTFLNSHLKRLRKSNEINYVKKIELIHTVKDPYSAWKIYSCIWSIPIICGWENLSWKSLLMQTVPKNSSLPMVVYQTAVLRFNQILSIKHKKKIYIFLNSNLKGFRKSNEINYVNKIGSYIPSKILARLERFILADEAFRSFVVDKISVSYTHLTLPTKRIV